MHARTASPPLRTAGFTLVELMIVVVIATILLAIAVPSYLSQIRESRRTDARTALLDLAGREESYNATMNAYTNAATNLGYPAWPANVGSSYYQIQTPCVAAYGSALGGCDANANAPIGPSYYLTAIPINSQTSDTACALFAVDSLGNKYAFTAGGAVNTQTCWPSQ